MNAPPENRSILLFSFENIDRRECVSTGAAGSGWCTNPQIFGISPFEPADFEACSTIVYIL